MNLPTEASFADFARIARFRRSFVTALKAEGRLVLTEDGKRVRVVESLQRIEATRDPSKAAVTARHAAARGAAITSASEAVGAPQSPAGAAEEGAGDGGETDGGEASLPDYQQARARREHYQALAAQRDYEVSIGKLMDAGEVAAAVAAAGTVFRSTMESLPDTLAPQLAAERDESRARAILAESIEHALRELSRAFHALTARTEGTP